MVVIMVHIHKHQRVTIHSIQSAHFNPAKCMSRQQEVYPMGYITQMNREENCHLVGPLNFESIDQYNKTQQKIILNNG